MKNCLHFPILILCILLDHYVLKSYANDGNGYVPRDSHTWGTNHNYNGYEHSQEQQQQMTDGFQSQQQMSAHYQYQTDAPFVGSGETWYGIYGPTQNEYEPQVALESSNYGYYDRGAYVYEQQQLQHNRLHSDSNPYPIPTLPDFQQQFQNSQVDMNGYIHDTSQYQYQDGLEQMQDQYATTYNAPFGGAQPHELIGGQQIYGNNHITKWPNVYDTNSRQYPYQPETQQIYQPQHTIGYGYPPKQKNEFQYPTGNSQYIMPTTPLPMHQKLIDGQQKTTEETAHEGTYKLQPVAPDIGNPKSLEQSTTMVLLNKQKYKIKCPPDVHGIYPHPFSNLQYIKCFDGHLLIKPCRHGRLFSLSRRICDIKEYMHTFDTSVPVQVPHNPIDEKEYHQIRKEIKTMRLPSLTCPAGVSGKFVYPFLKSRYVKCTNGATEIESCMNSDIYSVRRKECMSRDKVDNNDHVEGIENSLTVFESNFGVICGPQSDGKYAHPEDWRKFVICHRGIITVKRCPVKKIFDITSKECIKRLDN